MRIETMRGLGAAAAAGVLLAASGAGGEVRLYYWGGAFGTWFWIDPTNDLIFVGMIQNLRGSVPGAGTPEVRALSARTVYPALTDAKTVSTPPRAERR